MLRLYMESLCCRDRLMVVFFGFCLLSNALNHGFFGLIGFFSSNKFNNIYYFIFNFSLSLFLEKVAVLPKKEWFIYSKHWLCFKYFKVAVLPKKEGFIFTGLSENN